MSEHDRSGSPSPERSSKDSEISHTDPDFMMWQARAMMQCIVDWTNSNDQETQTEGKFSLDNEALHGLSNPAMGKTICIAILLPFVTEIALKACKGLETDGAKRDHDLLKLFNSLKSGTRDRIEQRFKEKRQGVSYKTSVREILCSNRNTFVDWRYLHEKNAELKNNIELSPVINAIIEIYDEYTDKESAKS